MKSKQVDCHVFDGKKAVHNQSIEGVQSKRSNKGLMEKKNLVSILSTSEVTLTLGHVTKRKQSKSKIKTSRNFLEIQKLRSQTTTTPILEASMKTNTVK